MDGCGPPVGVARAPPRRTSRRWAASRRGCSGSRPLDRVGAVLAGVLTSLWSPDPQARPGSANEILRALGEPERAPPPSLPPLHPALAAWNTATWADRLLAQGKRERGPRRRRGGPRPVGARRGGGPAPARAPEHGWLAGARHLVLDARPAGVRPRTGRAPGPGGGGERAGARALAPRVARARRPPRVGGDGGGPLRDGAVRAGDSPRACRRQRRWRGAGGLLGGRPGADGGGAPRRCSRGPRRPAGRRVPVARVGPAGGPGVGGAAGLAPGPARGRAAPVRRGRRGGRDADGERVSGADLHAGAADHRAPHGRTRGGAGNRARSREGRGLGRDGGRHAPGPRPGRRAAPIQARRILRGLAHGRTWARSGAPRPTRWGPNRAISSPGPVSSARASRRGRWSGCSRNSSRAGLRWARGPGASSCWSWSHPVRWTRRGWCSSPRSAGTRQTPASLRCKPRWSCSTGMWRARCRPPATRGRRSRSAYGWLADAACALWTGDERGARDALAAAARLGARCGNRALEDCLPGPD